MTAQEIWTTFLDAGLPAEPLKQLGHDLFYQRSAPTGDGVQAVNMLAAKFGIQPNFMFMALKVDPDPGLLERKQILEQLAFDYAHHKPWAELNHMTTWYIGRIAFKVNIIKGGPTPTAPKPIAKTAAVATASAAVAAPKPAAPATATVSSLVTYEAPPTKKEIGALIGSVLLMLGFGFYKTMTSNHRNLSYA